MKKQPLLCVGAFRRRSRVSVLLCALITLALLWGLAPAKSYGAAATLRYEGFTYTVAAGKATITGYAGNNRADSMDVVTVPGKINDRPVVAVNLYNIGGVSLDFKQCTQLKKILMENVFFDKIVLSKAKELQTLSIQESGRVTSLNLNSCKKLTDLTLSINSLEKLSIGSCSKLRNVTITHTMMRTLSLSKCTALRSLSIEGTDLERLTIGKKNSLKEVYLRSNRLESLSVSGCKALTKLDFSYNPGLSVSVKKNRKLEKLTYSPWIAGGKQLTVSYPLKIFPRITRYTNR
jgi:Leucine-rich repeat (LRR) protein